MDAVGVAVSEDDVRRRSSSVALQSTEWTPRRRRCRRCTSILACDESRFVFRENIAALAHGFFSTHPSRGARMFAFLLTYEATRPRFV
uniref:Uncharacterized protein n=1 Tax=Oryza punctata TaxID=4537 RepID=A0A0E0KDQ9_ORYPU